MHEVIPGAVSSKNALLFQTLISGIDCSLVNFIEKTGKAGDKASIVASMHVKPCAWMHCRSTKQL